MSHFRDLEASYHRVGQFEHVRGGILSIHNLKIPSFKLGGGDPQIERATVFWILIEFLLDHVHLRGGLEVSVADQGVRRQDKNTSGKLGLNTTCERAKNQFVKTQLNVQHSLSTG